MIARLLFRLTAAVVLTLLFAAFELAAAAPPDASLRAPLSLREKGRG